MKEWENRKAWIAHFDILGFKNMLGNKGDSVPIAVLQSQIDDALKLLNQKIDSFEEKIGYLVFSDTFILFSKTEYVNDYPALISSAKHFIYSCLSMGLPVRGAISYGDTVFGHDNKILMGTAFLESHEYGEDQNWLGLILAPSATEELKLHHLFPERHGFVNCDLPLRRFSEFKSCLYAYKFINGSTSFECPLLPKLNELMLRAPEETKEKYSKTIEFIKQNYVVKKNS